jgi:hypothetical protein
VRQAISGWLESRASAVLWLQRSRSQFATLKRGHNIKYRPYASTEHGAIMAATVLNFSKAVEMSVFVVRAFVKMREQLIAPPHWRSDLPKSRSYC